MRSYLTEALGTFFLLFAIAFSSNPLAIGLMLSVMVYCGGHISGAHYNPAVTAAFLIRRKISLQTALGYFVSQIVGATCACALVFHTTGKFFAPAPDPAIGYAACALELIATFALAWVILTVATASKLKGNYIYGFAIGLTVAALAFSVGALSGGAFNPAVALGPMLTGVLIGSSVPDGYLCAYIVSPILGGILAAVVFGYLNEE